MESNPYLEARREWDERYANLVLGKRNWQIAAGGLLLLTLILASDIVWLGSRSRYIPYVVEVDKLGYALTVPQPLTPVALPDVTARMERYEVAAFIRDARSVTSDPRNAVPHLAVKPQAPGIATNLTIYTTKHIYHLLLRTRGHAMQEVEFYYPDELVAAMKSADAGAAEAKQQTLDPQSGSNNAGKVANAQAAQLNFGYAITGPNVWRESYGGVKLEYCSRRRPPAYCRGIRHSPPCKTTCRVRSPTRSPPRRSSAPVCARCRPWPSAVPTVKEMRG